MLEVPGKFAGIGMYCQGRVCIKHIIVARAPGYLCIGYRHARAVIDHVELRVIGPGCPWRRAPAIFLRYASPAFLERGVAFIGERIEAPEFLAIGRIMGSDVAGAGGADDRAPRRACEDLAVGNQRSGGETVALFPIVDLNFPLDLASHGIERHELGVDCGQDHAVSVKRDGVFLTHGLVVVIAALEFGPFMCVGPDQIARFGINCFDIVVVGPQEHDAVVYDRHDFLLSDLAHRPAPGQLQISDIVVVDLVERAMSPVVDRPSPLQPIGGVGIENHLVCHGLIIAPGILGPERTAHRQRYQRNGASRKISLHGKTSSKVV